MIKLFKDAQIRFTGRDGKPVSMSVSGISINDYLVFDDSDIHVLEDIDDSESLELPVTICAHIKKGEDPDVHIRGSYHSDSFTFEEFEDSHRLMFRDITEEVYGRRESCTQEFKLEVVNFRFGCEEEEEDHEKRLYEIYKKGLDLL